MMARMMVVAFLLASLGAVVRGGGWGFSNTRIPSGWLSFHGRERYLIRSQTARSSGQTPKVGIVIAASRGGTRSIKRWKVDT